jgi:hypothetical protein
MPAQIAANLDELIIITPISNSPRYAARAENYRKFMRVMADAGVKVVTVECAFGDRPYEVTERDNLDHVQVRSEDELWLKENLVNIGIRHVLQIYPDTKYIGWFDSDQFPISVTPRQWMEEIWHQLQHYEFVQCWEYLINFGPDNQPITAPQMSFMKTYAEAGFSVPKAKSGVKHTLAGHSGVITLGRTGLSWAASVKALGHTGGILDVCILGSADWHMAHCLVLALDQFSGEFSKLGGYAKKIYQWQERCARWIRKDCGYVPVTVGHWDHGSKVDRRYGDRGQILMSSDYDPDKDIKYDCQGLIVLETWEPRQIQLRDKIRNYFATRNEDRVAGRNGGKL